MNIDIRTDALERLATATRENISADAIGVYLENTATFSDDVFVKACRHLERTSAWFPKCAELRTACIACQPQPTPTPRVSFAPSSKERSEFWLEKIRRAAGITGGPKVMR